MSTFDDKAPDWETPERIERARELAAFIREHVPLEPSMRVIDLGAGTGLLGRDLAADVGSMLLTDPSTGMIEVARQRIGAEGLANVTAMIYDLPAGPPPGAPFDLAVSLMVLHHVEDTEAALRSIHAMLIPGGRIALVDLDEEDGTFHVAGQAGIHHQGFEQDSLIELAGSCGFGDLATRTASEIERNGRRYPLFLLTGRRR